MYVSLPEEDALAKCRAQDVGVSVVERLPAGGVRLVCMSSDGAAVMREKFKRHLITGEVTRARTRPQTPLW